MTACICLRGPLKKLASDLAEHELSAATVGELLRVLERAQPGLAGWVLDERGQIRRHINVFVNAEQAGVDDPIADGDRIDVLPAISGG